MQSEDFRKVFAAHCDALAALTHRTALSHPQLGALWRGRAECSADAWASHLRGLVQRAIAGDWAPYEAHLRAEGMRSAQEGVAFNAWQDLATSFQMGLVPLLIQAYGSDPERLGNAFTVAMTFVHRVLTTLGQQYVDSKERSLLAERRLADERAAALSASEERYRLLFDCSPLPMWLFDLETLAFLAVNDAAVRHYGYSREEFSRMTIKDIRPETELLSLEGDLSNLRVRSDPAEWKHRKKDGTLIEVEISAHAFTFQGRPARLILAHDVTERRRIEAQLRHAQKMDAVGQLAGGIAHDFNNLLTAIISFSNFARQDLGPTHPAAADLDEVMKAGKRAADLTRQLLAFSRKDVLQPRSLQLNEVVRNSARMLERLIGEHISLGLVLAPKLGEILADPGHLEQVIVNLVVNARDAMPKGGKLTLETAEVVLDETYVRGHIGAKPGRYAMLAVTDTGQGMDEATQARIFEPFFTTKATGQGTGLGLATVFGIVKQSGGDVCVYSAPGRGTTFKVYLPRTDEAAQDVGEAAAPGMARGIETVLLVEDDPAVRAVARRALTGAGFRVLEAGLPEEALQLAEGGEVALLLTDVVMPQMTGPELAQRLLATRPGLRVLFMSGYTGGALAHQGLVDAEATYLQKPFTPAILVSTVRAALDS